ALERLLLLVLKPVLPPRYPLPAVGRGCGLSGRQLLTLSVSNRRVAAWRWSVCCCWCSNRCCRRVTRCQRLAVAVGYRGD
ncbi:hypothetical protein CKF46_36225, partial [Klebsiella pneumoniae]